MKPKRTAISEREDLDEPSIINDILKATIILIALITLYHLLKH